MLSDSYLDESGGNGSLAAVSTDAISLGLGNDGVGVLGLDGVKARKVAGLKVVELLSRGSEDGSGAEGDGGKDGRELHFEGKKELVGWLIDW